MRTLIVAIAGFLSLNLSPSPSCAQRDSAAVARLVIEPESLVLRQGDSARVSINAYDAQGRRIANPFVRIAAPRAQLDVSASSNTIRALALGRSSVTVVAAAADGSPITATVRVTVIAPTIDRITVVAEPGTLYEGVTLAHRVRAFAADGLPIEPPFVTWTTSDSAVAAVDPWGNVLGVRAGVAKVSARVGDLTGVVEHAVAKSVVSSVRISSQPDTIRTGDVLHLSATPMRSDGTAVTDVPLTWSYTYAPDDSLVAGGVKGGPGIVEFGRFVANYPGRFTLIVQAGLVTARRVVNVLPRDVRRRLRVIGRGAIRNVHTSDLWPWHGADGRDYCLVGTWGGNGYAFVFDITNLSSIRRVDSIRVDARTINDVTVSPSGRYAAIAREGASNRVNGVVILDISKPAHPKVASVFSENLTGGVHNLFASDDYLFAVSGGQKYVVIDVRDIAHPKYVSEYEHPGARLHDLWVRDGIAYSAQSGAGTVVVDVGNGRYGGTIERPKLVTTYQVNSGHEVFPYPQSNTGRFYLFIGDEELDRSGRVYEGTGMRVGLPETPGLKGGVPQTSAGFTHIIDFTDPMHPIPVARYELEDYGSHDIIVRDDVLYQAYYEGGVRLVDVSGEMLGNLAVQGREIAVFKPFDPDGVTANAPFVMNAMPWGDRVVLLTDFNSGLWVLRLDPP